MRIFEAEIRPETAFGTPLAGDTLFGQLCWQVARQGENLTKLLAGYEEEPFLVVSSAFFCGPDFVALETPTVPAGVLAGEGATPAEATDRARVIRERKELKKKKYIKVKRAGEVTDLLTAPRLNARELWAAMNGPDNEKERAGLVRQATVSHNSINRLSGTTTGAEFAPFQTENIVYHPRTKLVIFFGVLREKIKSERVAEALQNIGRQGFGRDASTGMGRFRLEDWREATWWNTILENEPGNVFYLTGPAVPKEQDFEKFYYRAFTRFGRHGDLLAHSGQPFKNPVIMSAPGAVGVANAEQVTRIGKRGFCGRGIAGVSKAQPEAVHQGYSLALPVKLEGLAL